MIIPSRLVVFLVIVYNELVFSLQCIKKNAKDVKKVALNALNQGGIDGNIMLIATFHTDFYAIHVLFRER